MKKAIDPVKIPSIGFISLPGLSLLSIGELQEIGFKIVMPSGATFFAAVKATWTTLQQLKRSGDLDLVGSDLANLEFVTDLLGYPHLETLNNRYLGT
jgi:2-methylisocitrate lyase-like PEP mutase family enzyme